MRINLNEQDQAMVDAVKKICDKMSAPRKVYEVCVEETSTGKRTIALRNCLPLSATLDKIKAKVGDLSKYELGKWFKVRI